MCSDTFAKKKHSTCWPRVPKNIAMCVCIIINTLAGVDSGGGKSAGGALLLFFLL
jgi:hypothetical protein